MVVTPNWIAFIALLSWPVVTLLLFAMLRTPAALITSILGGYLLLPVGTQIKIPTIPAIDKSSVPAVSAFVCCLVFSRRSVWPKWGVTAALLAVLVVAPVITSVLNGDPIWVGGGVVLPGTDLYDGGSFAIAQFVFLIPFVLGWRLLSAAEDSRALLRALVVSGLLYSVLMLLEVRLSPQLHVWIYGYFPHEFIQQVRGDGFRPVVFLGHGLLVSLFAATTLIAATAFSRMKIRVFNLPSAPVVAYLAFVLFLSKSLGSLVYGVIAQPLVWFASPKSQLRVAVTLACVALSYPLLRAGDLLPASLIVELSDSVSLERAESLRQRLDQEAVLLARALERPIFGWGRFARSRVHSEDTGQDTSVTDGRWVITLGTIGLVGFLAEFGLLALPIFKAAIALKSAREDSDRVMMAALALIAAIVMLDQLPNSSLNPWSLLLSGALLGRAESVLAAAKLHRAASTKRISPQPSRAGAYR